MRCITTPGHRDRHHEMIGTGAALPSIYSDESVLWRMDRLVCPASICPRNCAAGSDKHLF